MDDPSDLGIGLPPDIRNGDTVLPSISRNNTPKSSMRRSGIRWRTAPSTWSIALAIGRVTEKRSTFDHAFRCIGISRIPAFIWTSSVSTNVLAGEFGCYPGKGIDAVPIAAPLPDVSGHIVKSVAVRRK